MLCVGGRERVITTESILKSNAFLLDRISAVAFDDDEETESELEPPPASHTPTPTPTQPLRHAPAPRAGCCVGVAPNSEERQLLQWFRESHALAEASVATETDAEPFEWVDMPVDGSVPVVTVTQERMQEIGLVLQNGAPPTHEDPARLFWIQAKPDGYKDKFGVWDPVGAQWKLFPGRSVVPIEQRIAPCGFGCCGADQFADADYGDEEAAAYTGTALEAALPHVRTQVRALPPGTRIPTASGWGFSEHSAEAYYTPHLRHISIDRSIPEAGGKRYVYKFPPSARVVPMEGQYTWNATNACWVYRTEAPGVGSRLLPRAPDSSNRAEFGEQQRDAAMRAV